MKKLTTIILSLVWVIPMLAQYDPTNPPEPETMYKVTMTAKPCGYTSGSGEYMSDAVITISTSAYSENYTFNHWEKDGEFYSDQQTTDYTVEEKSAHFVAIYDYTPIDPAEPMASNEYRLYLKNNIPSACSFNMTSGSKCEADQFVYVEAYKNMNYDFLGWYENGVKQSSALGFNYQMPAANATLEAKFKYNPINPDEPDADPNAPQDDVANAEKGDVNGDGEVNTTDAVMVINYYLGKITEISKSVGDMNNDNEINTTDAVSIINKYLNK